MKGSEEALQQSCTIAGVRSQERALNTSYLDDRRGSGGTPVRRALTWGVVGSTRLVPPAFVRSRRHAPVASPWKSRVRFRAGLDADSLPPRLRDEVKAISDGRQQNTASAPVPSFLVLNGPTWLSAQMLFRH